MKAAAAPAMSCVQRAPASDAFRCKKKLETFFPLFLFVIILQVQSSKKIIMRLYPNEHPETSDSVGKNIHVTFILLVFFNSLL